ncbi:hypothetical protein AXG93_4324s1270 [Marchantia polymorpha subsp. ruderalis]|uniref:Uncharacterized protein n=1 Tax=Marchantia polymorpha subsp. ruderalis TaxID=1480154 RepID=A0A176VZW7_MARPO|nr:hypothetical protein AXG93_4324s1270 [Marchantia polymorpha subsp. ruderalis]
MPGKKALVCVQAEAVVIQMPRKKSLGQGKNRHDLKGGCCWLSGKVELASELTEKTLPTELAIAHKAKFSDDVGGVGGGCGDGHREDEDEPASLKYCTENSVNESCSPYSSAAAAALYTFFRSPAKESGGWPQEPTTACQPQPHG